MLLSTDPLVLLITGALALVVVFIYAAVSETAANKENQENIDLEALEKAIENQNPELLRFSHHKVIKKDE